MPEADWILRVVTLGPPVVLVLALVSILGTSAAGKLEIRQTLVLSGIAAAFFITSSGTHLRSHTADVGTGVGAGATSSGFGASR